MAEAVKIQAEPRDPQKNRGTGSRVARKLRAKGRIPAIIYGHKQAPTPVSLTRESVWDMVKKSTHLAELHFGGSSETVMVRELQWDHLGKEIIHVDFARVSADEAIHTAVHVEIRGTSPGASQGGTLEILVHEIPVICPANAIPDALKVDVSNLQIGEAIHAKDLTLPAGVKLNFDPETLVVHVVTRAADPAPAEGETASQPEVIKPERKEKDKD